MLSEIFGVCATVTAMLVYVVYFRQTVNGSSVPNPATISIWFGVSVLNTITYFQVVSENVWQVLISAVFATSAFALLGYALYAGKFAKFGRVETAALAIAIASAIFWKISGNADIANLLLQVTLLISFVPVIAGLLRNRLRENPAAWMIAVAAYLFATASVLTDYNGNWVSLAYPIGNGVIGNGSVAILAFILNRKPSPA